MKNKKLVILLILGLLFVLTSCESAGDALRYWFSDSETSAVSEETYSYKDLSDSDKEIIDVVYNSRDTWEETNGYPCRAIVFFEDDGNLLFGWGAPTSEPESGRTAGGIAITSTGYVYRKYTMVTSDGFQSYDKDENDIPALEGAMIKLFGSGYDVDAIEIAKKNALADCYYRNILEQGNEND